MKAFILVICLLFSSALSDTQNEDFLSKTSDVQLDMDLPTIRPDAQRHPMRIEGHRGAGDLEAENTERAFKRAIELGIDGVEIDVWLTKDQVPVVVHGSLSGKADFEDGRQKIGLVTFEELKRLRLQNGERILSLAEVLDLCRDKISTNIEFKEPNEAVIEIVLPLIKERNMFEQVRFSAFHHYMRKKLISELEKLDVKVPVSFGFLSNVYAPRFPAVEDTVPGDAINVDVRYLRSKREECVEEIKKAHENSLKVIVWYPLYYIERSKHYDDFAELGVDTIITNNPMKLIEYFKKIKNNTKPVGV